MRLLSLRREDTANRAGLDGHPLKNAIVSNSYQGANGDTRKSSVFQGRFQATSATPGGTQLSRALGVEEALEVDRDDRRVRLEQLRLVGGNDLRDDL